MYESYWQLSARPFEGILDAAYFYPSESHQAAMLKLRYAVENHRQGALLAGASGLGKTFVVKMLEESLPEQFGPFVHVSFPQMPIDQLLAYIALELSGAEVSRSFNNTPHTDGLSEVPDMQTSVRRIERFLNENSKNGRHAIAVIDEVHLLEDQRSLEAIRLLPNFSPNGQAALTMLLVGQTTFLPTLDRMPQLEERLGVKCLLRPFGEQETADYINHRLKTAGAGREIFDTESLSAIHYLAHGNPRKINRLSDLSLLIGYAEKQDRITATGIEAIAQELVAVAPE
ncbi:MAG: AAA family ATPase [Planctomycetota bacterium]|nr:AAA family ATPase [Planctomycetota bacterium]